MGRKVGGSGEAGGGRWGGGEEGRWGIFAGIMVVFPHRQMFHFVTADYRVRDRQTILPSARKSAVPLSPAEGGGPGAPAGTSTRAPRSKTSQEADGREDGRVASPPPDLGDPIELAFLRELLGGVEYNPRKRMVEHTLPIFNFNVENVKAHLFVVEDAAIDRRARRGRAAGAPKLDHSSVQAFLQQKAMAEKHAEKERTFMGKNSAKELRVESSWGEMREVREADANAAKNSLGVKKPRARWVAGWSMRDSRMLIDEARLKVLGTRTRAAAERERERLCAWWGAEERNAPGMARILEVVFALDTAD